MSLFPVFAPFEDVPATIALTDTPVSTASASVYTFSGASLGAAAADRKIIVVADGHVGTNKTVSSLKVGDVSASYIIRETRTSAGELEVWIADVPTGTTGDVVITWSASCTSCGCGVFRATGISSTATATDGDGVGEGDATNLSVGVNVVAGGIVVASVCSSNTGGTHTYTFTGITESYDEVVDAANDYHAGGSDLFATASTPLTITAPESVAAHRILIAASFPPA